MWGVWKWPAIIAWRGPPEKTVCHELGNVRGLLSGLRVSGDGVCPQTDTATFSFILYTDKYARVQVNRWNPGLPRCHGMGWLGRGSFVDTSTAFQASSSSWSSPFKPQRLDQFGIVQTGQKMVSWWRANPTSLIIQAKLLTLYKVHHILTWTL